MHPLAQVDSYGTATNGAMWQIDIVHGLVRRLVDADASAQEM